MTCHKLESPQQSQDRHGRTVPLSLHQIEDNVNAKCDTLCRANGSLTKQIVGFQRDAHLSAVLSVPGHAGASLATRKISDLPLEMAIKFKRLASYAPNHPVQEYEDQHTYIKYARKLGSSPCFRPAFVVCAL